MQHVWNEGVLLQLQLQHWPPRSLDLPCAPLLQFNTKHIGEQIYETGPKCLRRKITWHGCDHRPQTSNVIPGTNFSNFQRLISQDGIYIDVLMGILSNFLGSMRSLAHGSGRISIYCHFVFCFKYPEHMSFNCVTFIMFSSCIYMYLLLRWEKVKDNCCKLFQRSFCSVREQWSMSPNGRTWEEEKRAKGAKANVSR